MDIGDVPVQLAERLGAEATAGLVTLLNKSLEDERGEWSEQVLSLAGERFERRLAEETSKLRVEMAHGFAGLRQEMGGLETRLSQEMGGLEVRLHKELAAQRVESLRWAFGFWLGQLAAMAALLAFMLRAFGR